jgi:hypothetical protein
MKAFSQWKILFYFIATIFYPTIHSLRILIYHDGLSPSQIAFSGILADLLVERGHIVVRNYI